MIKCLVLFLTFVLLLSFLHNKYMETSMNSAAQTSRKKKPKEKINKWFRLIASFFIDMVVIFILATWFWFFLFEMYDHGLWWSIGLAVLLWALLWLVNRRFGKAFVGIQKDGQLNQRIAKLENYFTFVSALYFVFLAGYYLTTWVLFPNHPFLFGLQIDEVLIYRFLTVSLGIISFLSAWFLIRVRLQGFVPGLILVFGNLIASSYLSSFRAKSYGNSGSSIQILGSGGSFGYGGFVSDLATALSQLLPLVIFIFLLSTMSRAVQQKNKSL